MDKVRPLRRRPGIFSGILAAVVALLIIPLGRPGHLVPASHAAAGDPAQMLTSRTSAGAGLATNGHIYVVGGMADSTTYLATHESYDAAANTWTARAPLPVRESGASVVGAANGLVYVIGGGLNNSSNNLFAYDPGANAWAQRAPVNGGGPGPDMAAATIGNKIYVAGGYSSRRLRVYDTATDTWTNGPDMLQPRQAFGLVAAPDGKLYAFGGHNGQSTIHASVEVYDPDADSWTVRADMSQARWPVAGALGADGRIYAVGPGASAEAYDPAANHWEAIPPPLLTRQHAAVAPTADGRIVVIGGLNGYDEPTHAVEIYSPSTQTWAPVYAAPTIQQFSVGEGAHTGAPTIAMLIAASGGFGGISQMSFSNDGLIWSPWEPYVGTKSWTLTSGEGNKTVYLRVRDVLGNISAIAQDTIVLDQTAPSGSISIPAAASASSLHAASPARTLQFTAADNLTPTAQIQMRLSNRPDFAGAIWKPYSTSATWDFTGGVTVYAQFKDEAGNVSQTYSQSLPGLPPSGSSPNPDCSPRPRIAISTEPAIGVPEGGGALNVTVSTTGSNNGLRAVRFDSFVNAMVHVGSQQNQTAPFAVSIPAGQEPTSLQFTLQRLTNGQPTTVRMSVIDGCGEWSTLVGGGPRAF